jgi:methionyl-tRNA formyltransferase
LTAEDRLIDWRAGAVSVTRRVRALSPEPGAETRFRGKLLKVFRASARKLYLPMSVAQRKTPGEIYLVDHEPQLGVSVGGLGVVLLEEVQPEGKRRMTGTEFVRGYRPKDGEILG